MYIYIHIYTHTCTYTCEIDMYIVTCDVLSDTFHDGATPFLRRLEHHRSSLMAKRRVIFLWTLRGAIVCDSLPW